MLFTKFITLILLKSGISKTEHLHYIQILIAKQIVLSQQAGFRLL